MSMVRFYMIALLINRCLHAIVVVDRRSDGQDVFSRNVSIKCSELKAHIEKRTTCRCNYGVRTFGSNDPPCTSFNECGVLRGGVGLIIQNNSYHKVATTFDRKCKIKSIEIWNIPTYLNDIGAWVDVTEFSLKYFNVSRQRRTKSQVSVRLPFESWQGQLIKIIFDCDKACAVFKVQGLVSYPFFTSKLNPHKSYITPTCLEACPEDKESGGGSGGMIAGVVVSVIIVAIGIVLIRVCRHKLPCWENRDVTNQDDMSEEPSCSKLAGPEYEELLLTPNTTTDRVSDDSNCENTNYENVNYDEANYEDPNYTVPSTTEPTEGAYYSVIALPHEYEEVNLSAISNPVYSGGSPHVINLDHNEGNNSISSPHSREVEENVDTGGTGTTEQVNSSHIT